LHRENDTFWNWLDEPASAQSSQRSDNAKNVLARFRRLGLLSMQKLVFGQYFALFRSI
jgi:hypothetical protein